MRVFWGFWHTSKIKKKLAHEKLKPLNDRIALNGFERRFRTWDERTQNRGKFGLITQFVGTTTPVLASGSPIGRGEGENHEVLSSASGNIRSLATHTALGEFENNFYASLISNRFEADALARGYQRILVSSNRFELFSSFYPLEWDPCRSRCIRHQAKPKYSRCCGKPWARARTQLFPWADQSDSALVHLNKMQIREDSLWDINLSSAFQLRR